MHQLTLLPTCQDANPHGERPCDVSIDYTADQKAAFSVRLDNGQLAVSMTCERKGRGDQIARFCYQPIDGGGEWFIVDPTHQFSINDQPTLGIQRFAPGDLLGRGLQSWFVTQRVSPQPIEAPASIREKICPMCGDKLGAAPVVECSCGRFLHLENPADPADEAALNCFLVARVCGSCGQPTTLEPRLVPEPPPQLQPYHDDELDLDSDEF